MLTAPQKHAEPPNKKVKFLNPLARDSSHGPDKSNYIPDRSNYDPDRSSKYGSERSRYGSGRSEYDTDRSEYDPDRYEYDPDGSEYEQGNMFLYVESKRAKMKREKERKQMEAASDVEFSPQELALATVPGMEFDPRERSFAVDELRPQPIIRKRKKVNRKFRPYRPSAV